MHKILHTWFFIVSLTLLSLSASRAETDLPEDVNKLVKTCSMCHGMDGNSKSKTIPSFAGINENYFKYTMDAYKNGGRKSDMMKRFVDNLSADDIGKLAKYYVNQTFVVSAQEFDESLAQKGKILHNKYCAKCHDNDGHVDPYNYGILGGQWMPYLQLVIKEYLEGNRRVNPMMVTKLKRVQNEVGPEGFEQLVHFYASVK
jgi:sulfide dehydrogenase cytochrome subunit